MTRSQLLVWFLGFALVLAGCYDFNNPVDPSSDNYQGFTSEKPTTIPAAPGTLTLWRHAPDPEHALRLTWPDNSDNEEGFRIERRVAPGSYIQIDTVGTDITEYFDTTLSPDTTYEFQVCAYNIVGDSAFNTGPAWDTAPAAVTGLAGAPNMANRIQLKWIDESSTNDTYLIERSEDGITFSERQPAGVLAADAESWEDTGLPSSTDYWYRVYALRTSDTEKSGPGEIGPVTSP